MTNPNATNPIERPSGDRNDTAPSKSEAKQEDWQRRDDLERQAQGTRVSGPDKATS